MHDTHTEPPELDFVRRLAGATGRRTFLTWAGLTVVAATVGCGDENEPGDGVLLGTSDTGVLNYAYALEQLEAAFYTQAVASPYAGITGEETTILTDIRDHEVIHRDFLKAALGANAIADLEVTFASVDFGSRASVLGAARTFEDLGVAAYNGAGQLLTDVNNLLVAGKIVSVEARHAAAIRDLLAPKTAAFAGDDVVTASNGLDRASTPTEVLAAADAFVVTDIDASGLA